MLRMNGGDDKTRSCGKLQMHPDFEKSPDAEYKRIWGLAEQVWWLFAGFGDATHGQDPVFQLAR